MPVTLTGVPSAISARTAPAITAPASADFPSDVSNNQPDQGLLDKIASLLAHAGLLDVIGTYSKTQTFSVADATNAAEAFNTHAGAGNGNALRGEVAGDDVTKAAVKGVSTGASPALYGQATGAGQALKADGPSALNGAAALNDNATVATGKVLALAGTAKLTAASNPAANDATSGIFLNSLHAKNIAKAWGVITMDHIAGPSCTGDSGHNVDTVIAGFIGADFTTATVFFKQAVTQYEVSFGAWVSGTAPTVVLIPCGVAHDSAKFTFKVLALDSMTNTAVFVDFTAPGSDMPVNFHVFGKQ